MSSNANQTALNRALDAAGTEWAFQSGLPDDQPSGMSEDSREAYLMQRLIGHLHTILIISGRLK